MSGILAIGLMAGCGQNKETSSTETESAVSSENQDNELVFVNYRDIQGSESTSVCR